MNEEAKTATFWAVAAVMAAIATFMAWPTSIETDENAQIGKILFEKFSDPLTAASMKIVTFDDQQSALSDFEVAKGKDGVWRIPTHGGYIADAEEQMQAAATLFLDNRILDVSTTNREDHARFGVLDPTSSDVKVGAEGVGRLVNIKDDQGGTLVSLIVGNEVEDREGQRYVRRPGQDIVYAVELDDSALTTRFTNWIEEDLLQLTPFDVAEVNLKNYTASLDLLRGRMMQERDFEATVSTDGSEWNLESLQVFRDGTGVPRPLKEGEQLDRQRLNELKRALDELKIADVGRKPEGMSADLKVSAEFANDEQSVRSLLARGFIPAGRPDSDETEIYAANGEIAVSMKDGVRYILRFGNVAGLSEEEQNVVAQNEGIGLVGSNRYMLVTTELDESMIPVPDLQTVPQSVEDLDKIAEGQQPVQPEPEDEANEMNASQDDAAATQPAAEDKPAEDKPAEDKPAEDKPAEDKPAEDKPAEDKPAEDKPAEDKPAEDKPAEDKPAEDKPAEKEPSAETAEGEAEPEMKAAEASGSEEENSQGETATETPEPETGSPEPAPSEQPETEAAEPKPSTGEGEGEGESEQAEVSGEDPAENTDPVDQEQPETFETSLAGFDDAQDQDASAADPQASETEATPQEKTDPQPTNAENPAAEEEKQPQDDDAAADESPMPKETEQERRERLEAAQERITKENQRKLDAREEKLEAARKRVAELNARFADWYYEISESTFNKLYLSLDDLLETEEEAAAENPPADFGVPGGPGGGLPQFNIPGGN